MKGAYSMGGPEWNSASYEVKHFIQQLLVFDPAKRYSAEQALQD